MSFESLGISSGLLAAIERQGYKTPTAIQSKTIPAGIAGRDILGCAQTGTGKTAAFAIPILHRLTMGDESNRQPKRRGATGVRPIRALILAPTRELAAQIGDCINRYGKSSGLRSVVIFGGVNQNPQAKAIHAGVDILIATPGRLLDLESQKLLSLRQIEILVLDEADHMLDMGFFPDVRRIIAKLPNDRQTMMFSATMPIEIMSLAQKILVDPTRVQIDPQRPAAQSVDQKIYHVAQRQKLSLLAHLIRSRPQSNTIVFTRTKHGANAVVRKLAAVDIEALAIHGNKSQTARTKALDAFKSGELKVLVATDIAARGIDVSGVGHVINFDLPQVPETYVHRIGRTGRAGRSGSATSFCNPDETPLLREIEAILRMRIPLGTDQPKETLIDGSTSRESSTQSTEKQTVAPKRGSRSTASPKRSSKGKTSQGGAGSVRENDRRPEHMRAKKAKAPTKQALVESMLIRKGRKKPPSKPSHFDDPSPLLQ